ncbi:MAG: MarR family transcriptional regulator [Clostridia bacterium]|nr:MarR family transcriptional regulator [Clostridia bacterium]
MDYSQILKKHLFLHLLRKEAMRQNAVGLMGCQMPILTYIDRKPGCTQADLARKMFVSPASIAKSIDRLENSGLVTREVSQDSKRQYTLFLTENAKKALAESVKNMQAYDEKLFFDFSDQDLATLNQLMDKLIFNVTGENKEITHETFAQFKRNKEAD